jgi:hypothetical protein
MYGTMQGAQDKPLRESEPGACLLAAEQRHRVRGKDEKDFDWHTWYHTRDWIVKELGSLFTCDHAACFGV